MQLPGAPPVAIALLGMQRSDMQLLHVASKLGPLVGRLAPQIAATSAAKKQKQQQKVGSSAFPWYYLSMLPRLLVQCTVPFRGKGSLHSNVLACDDAGSQQPF